ncbi:hypothetical protein C8R45DRAFT_1157335 [Mycena sanguinolenta]|nr:hypothetical protein C8R45DRAFT_1157335 [Mycena sanguinolenta]
MHQRGIEPQSAATSMYCIPQSVGGCTTHSRCFVSPRLNVGGTQLRQDSQSVRNELSSSKRETEVVYCQKVERRRGETFTNSGTQKEDNTLSQLCTSGESNPVPPKTRTGKQLHKVGVKSKKLIQTSYAPAGLEPHSAITHMILEIEWSGGSTKRPRVHQCAIFTFTHTHLKREFRPGLCTSGTRTPVRHHDSFDLVSRQIEWAGVPDKTRNFDQAYAPVGLEPHAAITRMILEIEWSGRCTTQPVCGCDSDGGWKRKETNKIEGKVRERPMHQRGTEPRSTITHDEDEDVKWRGRVSRTQLVLFQMRSCRGIEPRSAHAMCARGDRSIFSLISEDEDEDEDETRNGNSTVTVRARFSIWRWWTGVDNELDCRPVDEADARKKVNAEAHKEQAGEGAAYRRRNRGRKGFFKYRADFGEASAWTDKRREYAHGRCVAPLLSSSNIYAAPQHPDLLRFRLRASIEMSVRCAGMYKSDTNLFPFQINLTRTHAGLLSFSITVSPTGEITSKFDVIENCFEILEPFPSALAVALVAPEPRRQVSTWQA